MGSEVSNKMKLKFKRSVQVLFAMLIMLMAVTSVSAAGEEFDVFIDFEDAQAQPGSQYWGTHGIKFMGEDSTILRNNAYNRGGAATASGEYSIINYANYPHTSANKPLIMVFDRGVAMASFMAGNGKEYGEQVLATITLYNKEGEVIGSDIRPNIGNDVTTGSGFRAQEPVYKAVFDYGDSLLVEEIDDLGIVYWDFPELPIGEVEGSGLPVEEITSDESIKCTETNGGLNYNQKGTATGNDEVTNIFGTYSDSCGNKIGEESLSKGSYIAEKHCSGFSSENGPYVHTQWYGCPNGCVNGACVKEIELVEEVQKDCTDPDGTNVFTKTWAKGWSSYNQKTVSWGDHCAQTTNGPQTDTGIYIYEAICDATGHVDYLHVQKCPSGTTCSDGACIATGTANKEICGDGLDNDNDGRVDCFDADCSPAEGEVYQAEDFCTLKNNQPTCCLFHEEKFGSFVENFELRDCQDAGRYPVTSESVCKAGIALFGYNYEGDLSVTLPEDLPVGEVDGSEVPLPIGEAESSFVDCLNGCSFDSKCLPIGTRLKENGDNIFCHWDGATLNQLDVNDVCQNDYECSTNSCLSDKCADLSGKLDEQQNLLEKILAWLQRLFS
jgi:hypothetical protein